MIKANELRIGNNYMVGGQLITATAEDIIKCRRSPALRRPIPLTPEILEKCGFEKQGGTWFFIEYFTDCMEAAEKCGVTINLTTGRCFIFQNDEEEGADGAYLKHRIKHLHQLQNLYFALTGEELKYTP